jgi:hypothetical protein
MKIEQEKNKDKLVYVFIHKPKFVLHKKKKKFNLGVEYGMHC